VGLPFFLENVGLGPELQARLRQPEAARQVACPDEHRRRPHFFRALYRRRENVVVREQLDRALREPGRVGDEYDLVARLAARPDRRDPVGHASGKLQRRLTRDMRRFVERQGLERGRTVQPGRRFFPADDELRRRGDPVAFGHRFVMAGEDLPGQLLPVRAHIVRLRDEHVRLAVRPEVIERRRGSVRGL